MNDSAADRTALEAAEYTTTALDAEADQLNAVERARLAAARRRALDRVPARALPIRPWHGLAVAAVLLAVLAVPALRTPPATTPPAATASAPPVDGLFNDLALLSASEDVDFYQDLEFLIWLEDNNDHAG
ncbi:MAG: hypothetical protein AAF460_09145 [Pseudomonadota bacterium]